MKGVRKNTQIFISELSNVNPNIEIIGEYVKATEKILCRCKIDGWEWTATPHNLLRNHGCPKCKSNNTANLTKKPIEDFLSDFYKKNTNANNIEFLSDYKGVSHKIRCKCRICKHIWFPKAEKLLLGQGCPSCNHCVARTTVSFKKELFTLNNEIKVIGEYVNVDTPILCKCKKCNAEWSPIPYTILHGSRCPKCHTSRGEEKCIKIFSDMNILYVQQKKFDNLVGVGNRKLSYDFYLPNYNLLIEFQGEQHEKPVAFGGKTKNDAKKAFEKQQEHDKRKRDYAELHNIELLEIWYYDIDKIEEIIKNRITEVSYERMVS